MSRSRFQVKGWSARRGENMKKLLMVLGVMALLAAALSVTAATTTADDDDKLVVDVDSTFIPSTSFLLAKGELGYVEGDVFEEGQTGVAAPIGKLIGSFVATEPVGTRGSFNHWVYRIFGEGDIHVAHVREDAAGNPPFEGAITGGTGEFEGEAGEFSATILGPCCPFVIRATFAFD